MRIGLPRLVVLLTTLGDGRVQQVDDLLPASGRGVELAAHLGEPLLRLAEPLLHLAAEVVQVLACRVEAGRGGLAEVPDLSTDLSDVTVSSSGQHARRCRVLLTVADAIGKLPDLGLQGGHADFQIVWLSHAHQRTECPSLDSS